MSTLRVTDIQHPSASTPAIELDPVDGVVFTAASFDAAAITSGVLDAARVPVGSIIAVKHALFTGTQTNSTATTANFAITDLSITHALADAANKLIITVHVGSASSSDGTNNRGNIGLAVFDGTNFVAVGGADGVRTRASAGGAVAATAGNDTRGMPSFTFVHEPGDTTSRTYTVRAINSSTVTQTIYINRSEGDGNSPFAVRSVSSFVIQEVKA
jgi:hypothetical protein